VPVLAVDVGTSHTVAVLRDDRGRDRPLLFDGTPLLPSAVFAGPTGELYVGRDAVHAALTDPARFEPNPKRRVDEGTVLLGDRAYPVVDLIAAVLRRVAAEAARTCGELPPTVLTHPAGWGPARRALLTDAATRAGLPVLATVPEPVAAAAYFTTVLAHRIPPGGLVGVFDFGGGTLDVAVVRRTHTALEVIGSGGLDDLGGLDLDAAVVTHLGTQLATHAPEIWHRLSSVPGDGLRDRVLFWSDARSAKEILTRASVAPVPVPGYPPGLHLTREEFEALAAPLLRRAVDATAAVLRGCRVAPIDLAGLFLVGGSSRIPLVARLLHTTLGLPPTVLEQPELAVAEGALHTDAIPAVSFDGPPEGPPGRPEAIPADGPAGGPAGESTLVAGRRQGRGGQRRAVLAGLGVLVALVAGAGTAAALGAFSPGSGRNPATGHGASGSATASASSTPMAFNTVRPSTLARNADLKKFLSGWGRYPTPWKCAHADKDHTVGTAGQPSNSAQRGVPDEAIFCKQADLELYVAHYRSGAELDRQRYVGASQPLNPENPDLALPKGLDALYELRNWGTTEHAVLWTDRADQGHPATMIGVLATSTNQDLEQVWYAVAAEQ
jgi:actin-like ATPase involved in cell morphogenesis